MTASLISVELDAGTVTPRVVVDGELEISTVHNFTQKLTYILGICPRVILDIRRVKFLDSAGLRALFMHRDCIQAVLVEESSAPARALSLSGFGLVLPLATDV